MPLRNRVTPFGDIIATEARGTLYGNRGVLHNHDGVLVRQWQVRRWIACVLEFKGRRRPLLRPGRFTELFFLDEATALAAGHRPCAECRRRDFNRFREAWAATHRGASTYVDRIDRTLHAERVTRHGEKLTHRERLDHLPAGALVSLDGEAWLVTDGMVSRWSPFGYGEPRLIRQATTVDVLTPPSLVAVIRSGYDAALHPTAPRRG